MYFRGTDYDDIIGLEYRRKSALENVIQEESHADGKDEHFAILESSCGPKRKPLRPYLGSPTLVCESAAYTCLSTTFTSPVELIQVWVEFAGRLRHTKRKQN